MLISIIIPVYNVEKYLEQCVMSFIMQIDNNKRGDVEIILVDDGSKVIQKNSGGVTVKIYRLLLLNVSRYV